MAHKNIIGIDFGASFTKLAFRQHDPENPNYSESTPLFVDGRPLIPTLGIETNREDRPWIFGMQAASMKPGKEMRIHRNWKSQILRSGGDSPDEKTLEVARNYFEWLLEKISEPGVVPFNPLEASVMLCVPAFKDSGDTMLKLGSIMEAAGWRNQFLLRTTEPKANTIGYCTEGRNANLFTGLDWDVMFGTSSPFISFTRQHLTDDETAALAILDIGSFTSDLSLINWHCGNTDDYLNEGIQESFRHGIVDQLDAVCLPRVLDDVGESLDDLPFELLEELKHRLYNGDSYEVGGYTIGDENDHRRLIQSAIQGFAGRLWELMEPIVVHEPIRWFLLTGGGASIPGIRQYLDDKFLALRTGAQRPRRLTGGSASRNATAIGATSIILTYQPFSLHKTRKSELPVIEPLPPLRNCSCGGANKNCMRCGGTGVIDELVEQTTPPQRRVVIPPEPLVHYAVEEEEEEIEFETEDLSPKDDEEIVIETVQFFDQDVLDHTLEGWMGSLVFGSRPGEADHNYHHFKSFLESNQPDVRNRCWYRLLCLACSMGARVPRTTIQTFWRTTLDQSGFWDATTSPDSNPEDLDRFFETLIHRDFRSIYADGEQAELLRRVFYDFRKLRHLVYENDFAEVILEVLAGIEDGANPVLFLRSGALPDGSRWKGVIGQSMTSPLLFLMREWRRMGLIASNRMDHHCYYMNAAARRGACRKGWLSWDDLYLYSLPDILEASRKVHESIQKSEEWDSMLFDLPLQIMGSRRRRRRS